MGNVDSKSATPDSTNAATESAAALKEQTMDPIAAGFWSAALGLVVLAVAARASWARAGIQQVAAAPADLSIIWFTGLFLGGVALRELVQGATWILVGGLPMRSIRFGIDRHTWVPFVRCQTPIRAWAYRAGKLMPTVVTGAVPFAYGFVTDNAWAMWWATLMLASASGDWLVLGIIRRTPSAALLMDHPARPGCLIVERGKG